MQPINKFSLLVSLNTEQIIFLIVLGLVIISAVSIVLVFVFRKSYEKKYFDNTYYKTISKIAFKNDYYLINNFEFNIEDVGLYHVNHILFGNKFIYLICNYYYECDLIGNQQKDKSFIGCLRNGKKQYTDNEIITTMKPLLANFSNFTNIESGMLVGIICINSDAKTAIVSDSKQFYIIQHNRLAKLIKAIESRPIKEINSDQLQHAVLSMNELNLKNKGKK